MSSVPPPPHPPGLQPGQQVVPVVPVTTVPAQSFASTGTPVATTGTPTHMAGTTRTRPDEITLVSHSNLFYWWPVWAISFLMAAITYMEGNRLAVVPAGTTVVDHKDRTFTFTVPKLAEKPEQDATVSLLAASGITADNGELKDKTGAPAFKARISEKAWPGVIFVVGLILTIIVTNVPLRGLWSFLVIIAVIAMVLLIALLGWWESIFERLGNLHIHINMAGYLAIGSILFGIWAMATFVFDRRSFVTFKPGQVQICEHIGDAVQNFSSTGVALEKQRDDVFRHYIFGLGSGDLILKIAGADRQVIRLPNVLFLGFRLDQVNDMLRTVSTHERAGVV